MNKIIFYVFGFVLAGVHATGSGCKDAAGNEYADGDSFLASDGCNRCFCSDEKIGCTKLACPGIQVCVHNGIAYEVDEMYQINCNGCRCTRTGNGFCPRMKICPRKICRAEDGHMYARGEEFLATDGCNICTCVENGCITCTRFPCQ